MMPLSVFRQRNAIAAAAANANAMRAMQRFRKKEKEQSDFREFPRNFAEEEERRRRKMLVTGLFNQFALGK